MSLLGRILYRLFGRPQPDDPGPETIVNIATYSGWSLKVTKWAGVFGAELRSPDAGLVYRLRGWKSFHTVMESVQTYLRGSGLSHVASALRAAAEAEVHE